MSEYQHHALLALDRPLTEKQRAELRSLSTVVGVVARRAAQLESDGGHTPR